MTTTHKVPGTAQEGDQCNAPDGFCKGTLALGKSAGRFFLSCDLHPNWHYRLASQGEIKIIEERLKKNA